MNMVCKYHTIEKRGSIEHTLNKTSAQSRRSLLLFPVGHKNQLEYQSKKIERKDEKTPTVVKLYIVTANVEAEKHQLEVVISGGGE